MNTPSNTSDHIEDHHLVDEKNKYYAFVNLALFLSFLTFVEIVIIFLPFAKWVIISWLIGLSIVKFFAVIFWFMHLIYDHVLLFLIFLSGLILAVGTVTALIYLFSPQYVDYSIFNN